MSLEIQKYEKEVLDLSYEMKNAQKMLDFYMQAIRVLPNPIFIKNKKAEFVFFNDAYKKYFNIQDDSYINKSVLSLDYLPLEDRQIYQLEDINAIETGSTIHYEKVVTHSNGDVGNALYWSKGFSVKNTKEKGLVGEIVDISKEKQLKKELDHSVVQLMRANQIIEMNSKTDFLTKLYNRRVLEAQVPQLLENARKNKISMCVLLVDIDNFKSINDTYGHSIGDEILSKFATILREFCCYNDNDILIRYGGDEFLIILSNNDLLSGSKVAERINLDVQTKLLLPNNNRISVSIGVTEYQNIDNMKNCISRADAALYKAKENGRNCVEYM